MTEKKIEKLPYEECGGIGCWAEYDRETGELIRVVACMAANYLNNPLSPEEIKQGKRLAKNCPIGGELEPID